MKVISDLKNDLLNRREIKLVINADKNPGYSTGKLKISEKYKANDDLVVVKGVKSKFGRNTFLIEAFIYDSKEAMEKIESKPKKKKSEADK